MDNNYHEIQELLHQKADLYARLKLLPYDGTPEVKTNHDKKYLYIRKRVAGKLTSEYIDVYNEDLYAFLLKNAQQAKELKKQIRKIEKQLAFMGYSDNKLSNRVMLNIQFARINMKTSIYDQAVLEGIGTTFPQTEDIVENGLIYGVAAQDVQKILNLKHAWEFIMDPDVLSYPSDYSLLSHIAGLVNEGFYQYGGRIRGVPVTIGTFYIPPLPIEAQVKEQLNALVQANKEPVDIAISLCLYCMKTQIFNDGNKRSAVLFANHYLISKGSGLLVIPNQSVSEFKQLLIRYYEDKDNGEIYDFLRNKAWRKFD